MSSLSKYMAVFHKQGNTSAIGIVIVTVIVIVVVTVTVMAIETVRVIVVVIPDAFTNHPKRNTLFWGGGRWGKAISNLRIPGVKSRQLSCLGGYQPLWYIKISVIAITIVIVIGIVIVVAIVVVIIMIADI